MSPSHSRHTPPALSDSPPALSDSPPALSDDDIISVFLRIPPDDPAPLVRASLVCKAWRRILTGAEFCRLYRESHGTPPMLGFFINLWSRTSGEYSRFIPTTAFRLPSGILSNWEAIDSRHGRILVEPKVSVKDFRPRGYVVWDPITNDQWRIRMPKIGHLGCTAAVLCAKEHCDHLGCHGRPFLVAMVASKIGRTRYACVYSSESGVWSPLITLKHRDDMISHVGHSILVGNTLHFPFTQSVLQYKLDEQKLSVIDLPKVDKDEGLMFMSVEDDVLVFAGLRGTRLSLWSTKAGALAWEKRTVIDLEKLLPPKAFESKLFEHGLERKPFVSGFAKGAVFLSTMAGLFTIDLNSGRTEKVAEVEMAHNVIPWISFYTQDRARQHA